MDLFSPWYFAAILCIAMLLVLPKRLFSCLDNPVPGGRLETLDGLRGILALAVFGHHVAIMHGYLKTGIWQLPTSGFYTMLGQMGVSFFFMITGYLFWGRLLNKGQTIDWRNLYVGRLFRIGPLYIFAAVVAIALSFHRTGWTVNLPARDVSLQISKWSALGFYGQPDVNGYKTGQLLAGVTWTLYYEWLFYLLLPALAIASNSRSHLALIVTTSLLIVRLPNFLPEADKYFVLLFLAGMSAASIHRQYPKLSLKSPFFSVVAIALLVYLCTKFSTAYEALAIAIMAIVFLIVASGSTVFGILTARPALRLGNLSYSIYLLHGLVLTFMFSPKLRLADWSMASTQRYWVTAMLITVALVLVSLGAYQLIEKPGMALGKKINEALTAKAWKATRLDSSSDQVAAQ